MTAKSAFLIFTNESCLLGNKSYEGLPLLMDSRNQIVEAPSNWLRNLMFTRKRAASSVRQFAYQLKKWWSFLDYKGIKWDEVDDFTIAAWRDSMLDHGNSKGMVNSDILTVFRFYQWAEKEGFVSGLIGEVDIAKDSYPSISVISKTNRKGGTWYTTPLLMRTVGSPIYQPQPMSKLLK